MVSLNFSQIQSCSIFSMKPMILKVGQSHVSHLPLNPSNILTTFSLIHIGIPKRPFKFNESFPNYRARCVKCSSSSSDSEKTESKSMKELLSGMVDERVEELLRREENKPLLDGLEKAYERVERAKSELENIKKQELEAAQIKDYISKLESRTSEVAECQKDLLEAKAMAEEAERSLSSNLGEVNFRDALGENGNEDIEDTERFESIKAASISAVVGTLAAAPISFSQPSSNVQLILHLAIIFISCALFGVTFRYTIRRDLDNIQLKTGTAGAFSFVKGLAELEMGKPLELINESILSHAIDGAIYVSQNLLIFIFAAISLDYCFKMELLSPFPMRKPRAPSDLR